MRLTDHTHEKRVPVLYVDLDGTVRHGKDELGHFVNDPEDVVIFDDVRDRLIGYKLMGWRVVGVSNQGGIALGHVSQATMVAIMSYTQTLCGNAFDKIAWCSHHPDAADPEMARCWCRKPKAGLVIESALGLNEMYRDEIYPPHLALFVGDRDEDRGCAANAGIDFMRADKWRGGAHVVEPAR